MVRGGFPGRGRGRGGPMAGGGMKPRPPFIPHVPFDLVLAEPAFPPVESPSAEQDEAMTNVSTGQFLFTSAMILV